MASGPQGVPIIFNTITTDNYGFFISSSEGLITADSLPVSGYKMETVSQKALYIKVTGSIEGFDLDTTVGDASGSVELMKCPYPTNADKEIVINPTTLGSEVFIKSTLSTIVGGTGTFDFDVTSSLGFEEILYVRVRGVRDTSLQAIMPDAFTSSISLRISSEPTGSSKELVIEPYLTSPFYGTDCDVMYGNASQPVTNPFLQDIDYGDGLITPINNIAIISGTADQGTIPESFFTINSTINPTFKSLNTTNDYNSGSIDFSSQTSGGTYVAYWDQYFTSGTAGEGFYSTFLLTYLITPDGEAIEITNDDDMRGLLNSLFCSSINPTIGSTFGTVDGEVKTRATSISSSLSYTNGTLEYKGISEILNYDFTALRVYTTGSSPPGGSSSNAGGVVYPSSIDLTSHSDLPSKAREILTKNNII